jgi:hypothetical protein
MLETRLRWCLRTVYTILFFSLISNILWKCCVVMAFQRTILFVCSKVHAFLTHLFTSGYSAIYRAHSSLSYCNRDFVVVSGRHKMCLIKPKYFTLTIVGPAAPAGLPVFIPLSESAITGHRVTVTQTPNLLVSSRAIRAETVASFKLACKAHRKRAESSKSAGNSEKSTSGNKFRVDSQCIRIPGHRTLRLAAPPFQRCWGSIDIPLTCSRLRGAVRNARTF